MDNEESGFFGSRYARKILKKQGINLKGKTIINIDCVGVGTTPLVCHSTINPNKLCLALTQHLNKTNKNTRRYWLSISDHFSFKKYGAINISFGNKALIPKLYYLPNVHTSRDNHIDMENIQWLSKELIQFIN